MSSALYVRRRMPVGSWNSKLKAEPTFINSGFFNWKKAIQKFTAHQNSSCHKQAVLLLHQTTTGQPIVAQLSTAHQKQQQLARRCLITAVQSTRYLLRQGLAKITPRMHQNAPFWAQKSKKFSDPSPGGEGDTPSPHPTPSAPSAPRSSRLRRSTLAPKRHSRLRRSSPQYPTEIAATGHYAVVQCHSR